MVIFERRIVRQPVASQNQKGVALFVALIALVVMMIAAVALIRSTDTAQMISGNLAIKRDMTHESEVAVQAALANFTGTGLLVTESSRLNDVSGANYSASVLPSNAAGIPNKLLQASVTGETAAYSTSSYKSGVTYRYVIDRLCPKAGVQKDCQSLTVASSNFINDVDVSQNAGKGLGKKDVGVIYRISVRLTDPRGTSSYFQTTFASLGS